jgi:TRAP-type mannitol/chloroaromatic compound transport system permease large subunit
VVLVVIVLWTVLFGIASLIEAAGVRATDAGVITPLQRRLNRDLLLQAGQIKLRPTAMVL